MKLYKMDKNSQQRSLLISKQDVCFTVQAAFGTGGGNVPYIVEMNYETNPRVIEASGGVTKYGTHHPKHGWMNNSADFSGIAPTIDSTIHYWHTLLIEI